MSDTEVITGPLEAILWLAVLDRPGPLGGCIACRFSSVWHHRIHGWVHPRCVPRAIAMMSADDGGDVRVASSQRRGAYARHG